jgi:cytochrome c5
MTSLRHACCIAAFAFTFGAGIAAAQSKPADASAPRKDAAKTAPQQPAANTPDPGERAFQANCTRCHYAPEQLSRRISGTILMHMRVRASLSAQDERDIMHFLAP